MPDIESRPLYLHTIESLIADLVSGRPVRTSTHERFVLSDVPTRSALDWYRRKRAAVWTSKVSAQHAEDLVDSVLKRPPELAALPTRPTNANARRLRLKKLEAHRFAGLHKFGTPDSAPANYVHEFHSGITLFEGRNGSGKTSLLNAIIWALTGAILRPQREPEHPDDFDCWVPAEGTPEQNTTHKVSPLTPVPNVEQYCPNQPWIPADTWVELTFIDETGATLPTIRRSQHRSSYGKLREVPPNLDVLGVDPIAVRIGTVMPGLLPRIKVGSESELGRAVSQLTGLSGLVDLSEHARRTRARIDKEFVAAKMQVRSRADTDYRTAKQDLERILASHGSLKPSQPIPDPSQDDGIAAVLDGVTRHFEQAKSAAFESARSILGERFDASNTGVLLDIEGNTARALERVSQPKSLTFISRLGGLRKLTAAQLDDASSKVASILAEGRLLDALAQNPSKAARTRLYARIASWIADHSEHRQDENLCVVCSKSLDNALDPVTGKPVRSHICAATKDAAALSQTLRQWADHAQGALLRSLPEALRAETATTLPAHPTDLLRMAFVDELFSFAPFQGALGDLKGTVASNFDAIVKERAPLMEATKIELPKGSEVLSQTLHRLDLAIRFARWRHANDVLAREIVDRVLGRIPKTGRPEERETLTGQLLSLQETVKAAQPISNALVLCQRLKQHLQERRAAEVRLQEYAVANAALANLMALGELADEQVDQLRGSLSSQAAVWRSRIYLGAYPDTAHELVDAGTGRKGELDLIVRTGGIEAPAQHVSNASALRATLVGFFLAFWEHVLRERGGLTSLLLDDPQELLDDENRERLAASLIPLVDAGAQLILTSHDSRFCSPVSRLPISKGVEHLEVHPATRQQPVVRTSLSLPVIYERKKRFESDQNQEEPARDFADACRVFLEAKLGDMFDDPAHAAWAIANPNPTLASYVQRLATLVKAGPQNMFSAHVFRRFMEHPAVTDGSPVLALMNKAHHGRRQEIRAAEVAQCAGELSELLQLVEDMDEECYRWRRRDKAPEENTIRMPAPIQAASYPKLDVLVCPDLAAFTQHAPIGASQEPVQRLDTGLLDNTAMYYLRRPNFGFAAPPGSLAIVHALPGPVADRRLVIARHRDVVYARRLVRSINSAIIGLTAEIPDPRARTPKTIFLSESEVATHQVVGIIFDHSVTIQQGSDEAVLVDASAVLKRVQIAFRVVDDSAVPLALEKQIVLGGELADLEQLRRNVDGLIALTLDDGATLFKRVGAALPGELAHLVQFESIGGLGSSQILSVGKPHKGFRTVTSARAIVGVLYQE
jgi:hypothetical protein